MYTLLICADVYADKVNLELTFPHMPTIGDLNRRIVEVFNAEAALKRPEGYPVVNFTISKLQIYDDVMLKWTDLVTCSQLHEYDQLYAFQPQSPWHTDIQKDLPPPRPPAIVQRTHYSQPQHQAAIDYGTPYRANVSGSSPAVASHAFQSSQFRGSPTQQRLDEQRRKEEALRQELRRIHEETERLEAQAQREREEELRRQQEEADRAMRLKEEDIRAQREALQRAEDDLRRMQSGSSVTPQRNLYA